METGDEVSLTSSVGFLNGEEDARKIVIDNGSSLCRIGFANADAPRAVFPSSVSVGQHHLAGYQATHPMIRPLERGVVTDWEAMEAVWHYAFNNELRVSPKDYSVLVSDQILNPKINREKMTEIMLEKFGVGGLIVSTSSLLSLYANGRDSGVVVESGHGTTSVVSIQESCIIPYAIQRLDVGGQDVTDYLVKLLRERGYSFSTPLECGHVEKMKEHLCSVKMDWNQRPDSGFEKSFKLPDGLTVTLGDEVFRAPEILFNPSLLFQANTRTSDQLPYLGKNSLPGIPELIRRSVMSCETDVRRSVLCSSIIMSGGNTMFPGLESRLFQTVSKLFPSSMRIRVRFPPDRKSSAWIGGAIYATLANTWITRTEYDEYGPSVVHRLRF